MAKDAKRFYVNVTMEICHQTKVLVRKLPKMKIEMRGGFARILSLRKHKTHQ